ncbi:MAG: orotate phosphoribosyltransferase [Bacteroidales bacterium]
MGNFENQIAKLLLQSKAIKLNPAKPFQWASGWKSPIYCDNRKTLSYPEIRAFIKESFVSLIGEKFKNIEAIAGVATGAIAQGALVADAMKLPFLYVRSSAKTHGLENLVEGDPQPGQRVVVIEDLISTGSSSLKAVEALRNIGCEVIGMVAIFTYGFNLSVGKFAEAKCSLYTLSSYDTLLEEALAAGHIGYENLEVLKSWRKDPENWMK